MRQAFHRTSHPSVRRAAAWILAVAVASCSSSTTDFVSGGEVATVSVDPPTSSVSIGAQVPLQAVARDASGKTISGAEIHWSTQNASVATVSANGVVTGVALGTTQIAASSNGKSGIGTVTVEKTPVANVAVSPPHVDASPGDHRQFTAIAYDAAQNPLSGRTITWSSSNASVATVDLDGMATAVGPGTATITGTSEGKNGAATITVSQAPVATVTVTPNPLSMTVGQSTQLFVTLKDASGAVLNGRAVGWSSSNTGVATVDAQGVLTAVAQGSTTITATSEGKSGTAAITITNIAVGSVTIQPQGPSIVIGANIQLSATVRDVNGATVTDRVVTWASSNTSVATVSPTGIVTGVAPGTVTITATSEGKSGTTLITVTLVPVGSVTVTPATAAIRVNATTTLAAVVKDANGAVVTNRVVTWTSSNPAVATVSAGVVTGVAPGTVTITATSEGKSGTASVTVTAIPVASVTVSPSSKALFVLQTVTLTATVKDSTGAVVTDRPVTWTSSAPIVASVSSTVPGTAVVTALAPGTATITATSETKSGTSTITVSLVPISQVVVQPAAVNIPTNSTSQLTAIALDSIGGTLTGRTFSWSTTDATVAAVSGTGLVSTFAKTGGATITASSEGKIGTSAVTVIAPVATVTVAPASATILVTQTQAFTATLKDAQGNVLTGRGVSWASSNTAVATVNSATGVATGVAPGTVTITATSEGKSGTASLTVNPVPVATVTITPPSPDTVFIGYTKQLTAVTKDSAGGILTGRTVSWQSANPPIATVGNTTGLVSGVAGGSTTITATSEGKSGSVTMVSMKAPVGSVVVTPNSDSVTTSGAASTAQLTATVKDVNGTIVTDRAVTWASTSNTIATVNGSGLVTGKAVGTVKIAATSETKSDTSFFHVIAPVTTVTVNPSAATLSVTLNSTVQLAANCNGVSCATVGRTITWTSSNTNVATVDATGKVTAKTAGTAQITARDAFDNVSGTANITVTP